MPVLSMPGPNTMAFLAVIGLVFVTYIGFLVWLEHHVGHQ